MGMRKERIACAKGGGGGLVNCGFGQKTGYHAYIGDAIIIYSAIAIDCYRFHRWRQNERAVYIMIFNCCLQRKDKPKQKRNSLQSLDKSTLEPALFINLRAEQLENHYEVLLVIGQGTYGTVSKVRHKQSGLVRAMKTLPKYLLKESVNRLFKEVEILKTLDHPNIVRIYEVFVDESNYYIIMEFVSGGELFDQITKLPHFTEQLAANYMKQILQGVAYLHNVGIVHRDLKPENIVLDKDTLKIIDFGTSKRLIDTEVKGKIKGTIYYLAPESFDGLISEKADVWACGVIMHILLLGCFPFEAQDMVAAIKEAKFRSDLARLSIGARNLLLKMLQPDPKKRITAQEALTDEWIQKNNEEKPLDPAHMKQLEQFQGMSKLRSAIMLFIAAQIMNNQEKNELIQTFQQMDSNYDGMLSKEELIQGFSKIYEEKKAKDLVEQLIHEVDVNHSGFVDYSEFVLAATNRAALLNQMKLEATFKLFDANGDGYLSREELTDIMGGIVVDDDMWSQFLQECDENNDGQISQSEFINMLAKKSN